MNDMQRLSEAELFHRFEQLNQIGIALSKERDLNRLLESILTAAQDITNADGGTVYRKTEEETLRFEIMRNDTLGIAMGGTSGVEIPFFPIKLFDDTGKPNRSMIAAYAVHHDQSINIADAYTEEGFDFHRHQELRQEDRLPLEVVPHHPDEESRGRNHRGAAASERQGPRHR
jgi:hypothetical protein